MFDLKAASLFKSASCSLLIMMFSEGSELVGSPWCSSSINCEANSSKLYGSSSSSGFAGLSGICGSVKAAFSCFLEVYLKKRYLATMSERFPIVMICLLRIVSCGNAAPLCAVLVTISSSVSFSVAIERIEKHQHYFQTLSRAYSGNWPTRATWPPAEIAMGTFFSKNGAP